MWWLDIPAAAILGGSTATWVVRQHMLRLMARENDQHDRAMTGARAETEQLRARFLALLAPELAGAQETNTIVTDALRGMRGVGR